MAESEERPSKIRKLDPVDNENGVLREDQASESQPEKPIENSGDRADSETSPDHERNGLNQTDAVDGDAPKMSKSQLKKIRRKAEWEAGRESRKAYKKEKVKEKKARQAAEKAERSAAGVVDEKAAEEVVERKPYQRPILQPLSLIMDCDFEEYMTEKELISLGSQLTRCYADNKIAPYKAHLIISSWGGHLKERFETILASSHLAWKGVQFTAEDFEVAAKEADTFMRTDKEIKLSGALAGPPKGGEIEVSSTERPVATTGSLDATEGLSSEITAEEERSMDTTVPASEPSIVYLSSDSDVTLERLSPNTSYIIGGIVDKNRHKGICHKRAVERDIPTAKLPIGEYMDMQSRTVLTTNHVVEIMLRWMEEGDWGKAFMRVIPKRKEAKLKTKRKAGEIDENGADQKEANDKTNEGSETTETQVVKESAMAEVTEDISREAAGTAIEDEAVPGDVSC